MKTARGNGIDSVDSKTGTGKNCRSPMKTSTGECSTKTYVEGTGVVRRGDAVSPHPFSGCGNDSSTLTTYSSKVFSDGRNVGRIGDEYTSDNIITSGSEKVIIGS